MRQLAVLTLVVMVVEMSLADFVAVQRLTDRGRRQHFGLPESCTPNLTATRAARGTVVVIVTCAAPDADEPERPVRAFAGPSRFGAPKRRCVRERHLPVDAAREPVPRSGFVRDALRPHVKQHRPSAVVPSSSAEDG